MKTKKMPTQIKTHIENNTYIKTQKEISTDRKNTYKQTKQK